MAQEPKKVQLPVYVDSRLADVIVADAKKRGVYLTDIVAELIADHYQRPDLRGVPRKRVGRKLGTKMGRRKGKGT